MQKSKHITGVIGVMGFIDIALFILLLASNIFSALQNQAVLQQLADLLPNLDPERVVLVGVIATTIFSVVIIFNVLKVIFQLSIDVFHWQEILFIHLASSLLAFVVVYLVTYVLQRNSVMDTLWLNIIYGMLIVAVPNVMISQKVQEPVNSKLLLKLNAYLIAYALVNLAFIYFGASANG